MSMPSSSISIYSHFTPLASYICAILGYPGFSTANTQSLVKNCINILYNCSVPAPIIICSGFTSIPANLYKYCAISLLSSIVPLNGVGFKSCVFLSVRTSLVTFDQTEKGNLVSLTLLVLKSIKQDSLVIFLAFCSLNTVLFNFVLFLPLCISLT